MCFCYAPGAEDPKLKCPSPKGTFCSEKDNHFHYVVEEENAKIPVTPTTLQFKCTSDNGEFVYWLSQGLHKTFHDKDDRSGKAGKRETDEECFKQYGNLGTGSPFSNGSEVGSDGGLFWQTRGIANKIAYFPPT